MSTIEEVDKQEFQNDSPGWLGATVITGRNQDPKAIPVEPGGRIFLSREEQLLTSRAHQRDEDSPFKNGLNAVSKPGKVSPDRLVPYDEALAAEAAEPEPTEITGVEPQPAGEAAVGVQAQTEIAGTPEAQGAQPPPAPQPKPAPQAQKPQAPVPPKPAQ